jgi:uncharacterized protein
MIQPTPFCNIACKYCYLPDRGSRQRISIDTLSRIYDLVFPVAKEQLTILWHAGEPLVVGPQFYREAIGLQQSKIPSGLAVRNAIQTNGTLITPEWCSLFTEHGIHIGISLDGPQFLHDANRVDRRGRGTFERVMQGILWMREHGIEFYALIVLTRESLDYPDDIWDFLRSNGITKIAFNIEEIEGIHRTSSMEAHDVVSKYKRFIKRLLTLRSRDSEPVFLREIDFLLHFIKQGLGVRSTENTPFAMMNFSAEGDVSTFSPELLDMSHERFDAFTFGNVHSIYSLDDISHNPQFQRVWHEVRTGVEQCKDTCQYFPVCGGGAASNKLFEHGRFDVTETMSCRLRVKSLTDAVLEYLEACDRN